MKLQTPQSVACQPRVQQEARGRRAGHVWGSLNSYMYMYKLSVISATDCVNLKRWDRETFSSNARAGGCTRGVGERVQFVRLTTTVQALVPRSVPRTLWLLVTVQGSVRMNGHERVAPPPTITRSPTSNSFHTGVIVKSSGPVGDGSGLSESTRGHAASREKSMKRANSFVAPRETKEERIQKFRKRHGEQVAEEIVRQRKAIEEAVQKSAKVQRYVLHPDKNKWLGRWDVLTSSALLYTATITPFETAFIPNVIGVESWQDPFFIINRILDLIFFADMFLQFFVAYQSGTTYGGWVWVGDHAKIIRHYVTGWFVVDAATVFIPGGFDVYSATLPSDTGNGAADQVGMLRVLRVLRLFKLVRLVRASRLFQRWKAKITLGFGAQTMIQCAMGVLFGCHWYACIIALTASMHNDVEETWVGSNLYGLCNNDRPVRPGAIIPLANCNIDLFSWYLAALSWAMMVITGTGGTDFYPSASSNAETIMVTLLVLSGAFIWTMVLAAFCDVATNGDPALTTFRQQLDGLNSYIAFNNIPNSMARRMRAYMQQQKGMQLREELAKRSLPALSLPLQLEAVLYVHGPWLHAVWFIRELEGPVKVKLAMAMEYKVMAPGEVAPTRHLYVLTRGAIIFGGRVLTRGAVWGDDVILSNPVNFVGYQARVIKYSDVSALKRSTLVEIVDLYPESAARMRRATIFLATRRYVIHLAKEKRQRAEDESLRARGLKRGEGGDIIDNLDFAVKNKLAGSEHDSMQLAVELQKSAGEGGSPNLGKSGRVQLNPLVQQQPADANSVVPSNDKGIMDALGEIKQAMHKLQRDVDLLKERQASSAGIVRGARTPNVQAASASQQ